MKQNVKDKWVEALLSGEYKQTIDVLKDDNGFCCLGVLCDLYRKEHPDYQWKENEEEKQVFLGETETLPNQVMEWSGIKTPQGKYGFGSNESELSRDNDRGATFGDIVKIINDRWEEL